MFNGECTDVKLLLARIVEELRQYYPRAEAEFLLGNCSNPAPVSVRGPITTVLAALQQACRLCPGAWVNYDPHQPYGRVLKMIGHCNHRCGACDEFCEHYRDRPRAEVVIVATDYAAEQTRRVV